VDIDLKRRKLVDVQVIFMKMEPRTLSAAYKFFAGKELTEAHSAEADTLATYEILQAQLDRYDNLENDIGKLAEFSAFSRNVDFAGRIVLNDEDVEVFNFGKYKGKPVIEVLDHDPGYYGWMMNGDFPLYTKKVLTGIKLNSIKQ
jgi:DNA polymerase-3 subunit epsilon